MTSVLGYIENNILDFDNTEYFAAILGETPSKGARSPILWNAVFENYNMDAKMYPMDVASEKLESVLQLLKEDKRFIGGAVTMPYKIDIIPFLDRLEPQAEIIGAVNCLYKKGDEIVGANTDGAGALWSLEKIVGSSFSGQSILIIGTGGAGNAVAVYMAEAVGSDGRIVLANRTKDSALKLAARLENMTNVEIISQWPVTGNDLDNVDILINCTSLGFETGIETSEGFYSQKFFSPLGVVKKASFIPNNLCGEKEFFNSYFRLIKMNINKTMELLSPLKDMVVFDIIYQPEKTVLLYFAELAGLKVLNGLTMNLEQAVIAFCKASQSSSILEKLDKVNIREIMSRA